MPTVEENCRDLVFVKEKLRQHEERMNTESIRITNLEVFSNKIMMGIIQIKYLLIGIICTVIVAKYGLFSSIERLLFGS